MQQLRPPHPYKYRSVLNVLYGSSGKANSHMIQAQNQNKLLMSAYQARVSRLQHDKMGANSMVSIYPILYIKYIHCIGVLCVYV